jgi:membrane associated rhomboid family serine protease
VESGNCESGSQGVEASQSRLSGCYHQLRLSHRGELARLTKRGACLHQVAALALSLFVITVFVGIAVYRVRDLYPMPHALSICSGVAFLCLSMFAGTRFFLKNRSEIYEGKLEIAIGSVRSVEEYEPSRGSWTIVVLDIEHSFEFDSQGNVERMKREKESLTLPGSLGDYETGARVAVFHAPWQSRLGPLLLGRVPPELVTDLLSHSGETGCPPAKGTRMQNEIADWVAFQLVRRLGVQPLEERGLQALHLLSRRRSLYYVLLSTSELDAQNIRARGEAWREFAASQGSMVGAHVQLIYLLEEVPNRDLQKALQARVGPLFSAVAVHTAWIDSEGNLGGRVSSGRKDLKAILSQYRGGQRLQGSFEEELAEEPQRLKKLPTYFPWVHLALILLSFANFAWARNHDFGPLTLLRQGAFHLTIVESGEWWRVFSSGPVHLYTAHFWFNLVGLVLFCALLERRIGPAACGFMYCWAAVGATLAVAALSWGAQSLIGISGLSGGTSVYIFGALGGALHLLGLYRGQVPFEELRQFRFRFWLFLPCLATLPIWGGSPDSNVQGIAILVVHFGGFLGGNFAAQFFRIEYGGSLGYRLGGRALALLSSAVLGAALCYGVYRAVRISPLNCPTRVASFAGLDRSLELPCYFGPADLFNSGGRAYAFTVGSMVHLSSTQRPTDENWLEYLEPRVMDASWTLIREAQEPGWVRWRVEHPTQSVAAWILAAPDGERILIVRLMMPEADRFYAQDLIKRLQTQLLDQLATKDGFRH